MGARVLPNTSVLISVWLETFFYGIYVVIFLAAIVALLTNRSARAHGRPIKFATVLMFIVSTAHMGVNLRRLVEGFIIPDTKAETLRYLYDIRQPLGIAKQFLWVFNNILADGIIVWRLWVLWNWRVCVVPIMLLSGTTACGFATAISLVTEGTSQDNIFLAKYSCFAIAQYALSLTDNVLVTALIASRVWYITRDVGYLGCRDVYYQRIILMVIESGAVYALTQVMQLAFYVAKFPGLYFVADSFVQIMAIVPTAMVLAVALQKSSTDMNMAVPKDEPVGLACSRAAERVDTIELRPSFSIAAHSK